MNKPNNFKSLKIVRILKASTTSKMVYVMSDMRLSVVWPTHADHESVELLNTSTESTMRIAFVYKAYAKKEDIHRLTRSNCSNDHTNFHNVCLRSKPNREFYLRACINLSNTVFKCRKSVCNKRFLVSYGRKHEIVFDVFRLTVPLFAAASSDLCLPATKNKIVNILDTKNVFCTNSYDILLFHQWSLMY